MTEEYVGTGFERFPILRAAQIEAELQKLPQLARKEPWQRYLGEEDAGYLVEYHDRSEMNAEAVRWLFHMYRLWWEIRRSLASAIAIDTWYGGLPDDPWDPRARADFARFDDAESACGYHLDNAIYRFYSFNERFLQLCNGYLRLGLPEDQVSQSRIEKKLQVRKRECAFFADQLTRLCELPHYQDIAEARRAITHRQHPYLGDGIAPPDHLSAHYLRIVKELFCEITDLLDRLLERIAADDEEHLAAQNA